MWLPRLSAHVPGMSKGWIRKPALALSVSIVVVPALSISSITPIIAVPPASKAPEVAPPPRPELKLVDGRPKRPATEDNG